MVVIKGDSFVLFVAVYIWVVGMGREWSLLVGGRM